MGNRQDLTDADSRVNNFLFLFEDQLCLPFFLLEMVSMYLSHAFSPKDVKINIYICYTCDIAFLLITPKNASQISVFVYKQIEVSSQKISLMVADLKIRFGLSQCLTRRKSQSS